MASTQPPGTSSMHSIIEVLWRTRHAPNDPGTMPMYPGGVLWTHVVLKGAQAGSIVGFVGGAPYVLLKQRIRPMGHSLSPINGAFWHRLAAYSAVGGIALATAAGVSLYYTLEKEEDKESGITDRAFRLKYNESQNEVDRWSVATAIASMGLFSIAGLGATRGLFVGLGLGVLARQAALKGGMLQPLDEE